MSSDKNKYSLYVYLGGGLGNQLFQIANGYAYALRYNKKFYVSKIWNGVTSYRPTYWDSLLKNLQPYLKDISEFKGTLYKEPTWEYKEIPYIEGDVIFEGYFQCDKYFQDYSEDVRKLFGIYPSIKPKEDNNLSVCVHIRRGDYLKNPLFHTILQKDYYDSAKIILKNIIVNPNIKIKYIYFSEDTQWVKETFKISDSDGSENSEDDKIVSGLSDIEEFQMMVNCDCFILANSSFGWWASWFANSSFIAAPFAWFGPHFGGTWNSIYRKNFIIL
jgi:hypothetical protein